MSTFSQINTNIQSQRAFQNLSETSEELATRRERLTTGLRINSAEDDAAGFEIANQLEARTGAQGQALRNIGDSKSLLSTAEGALDSQLSILQTAKEKATQAANDSLSEDERSAIQGELDELTSEIQDIAENTTFNGKSLIDGGSTQTFQTGASPSDTFDVSLSDSTATNLGSTEGPGAIGTDTSKLSNGTDLQNASIEGGGSATDFEGFGGNSGVSSGNLTLQGVTGFGTGSATTTNLEASGVLDGDNRLKNLEGGKFELDITGDASSGFEVEVDGDSGTTQNLDVTGTGPTTIDGSSASTVVLESDTTNDEAIQIGFGGANADELESLVNAGGGTAELSVEVGGDGIEFSEDITKPGNDTERKDAIKKIDGAIDELTSDLSDLGATQNRLSFKESNLETSQTNLSAAQSRIEDADFAKEQTQVAKLQVQQQSGTAQLAQANAVGQSVLSLLQ